MCTSLQQIPNFKILSAFLISVLLAGLMIATLFPSTYLPIFSLVVSGFATLNFAFHEMGHIVFGILGQFIGMLGGTLGQLIPPGICLGLSFYRKRYQGAALFLFWLGNSLVDVSVYISDARSMQLRLVSPFMLFGGKPIHDWNYMLGKLGLLDADHFLGFLVNGLGIFLMAAAVLWPTWLVWRANRRELLLHS